MYDLAGENGLDLEALRARLKRMSERELLSFGRAARYMRSPKANLGKEPRQVFVIQLREAVKEWRRRGEGNHLTAKCITTNRELVVTRRCVRRSRNSL